MIIFNFSKTSTPAVTKALGLSANVLTRSSWMSYRSGFRTLKAPGRQGIFCKDVMALDGWRQIPLHSSGLSIITISLEGSS